MARCYLTGVGIALEEAFVLDLTAVHRVMRDSREVWAPSNVSPPNSDNWTR